MKGYASKLLRVNLTHLSFKAEPLAPHACMIIGERVYNLQRAFNVREGLTRSDDSLPPRVFEDPIPKGASRGGRIKRSEFERMLDDYYQARRWS